jgi:hypothetical protein
MPQGQLPSQKIRQELGGWYWSEPTELMHHKRRKHRRRQSLSLTRCASPNPFHGPVQEHFESANIVGGSRLTASSNDAETASSNHVDPAILEQIHWCLIVITHGIGQDHHWNKHEQKQTQQT